jgi:hypothetical protein
LERNTIIFAGCGPELLWLSLGVVVAIFFILSAASRARRRST